MKSPVLAALLTLCVLCIQCNGATWYISTTGSNSNTGTSPSNPLQNIQGAMGHCSPGDTIQAADGVYTGYSNVGVSLVSVFLTGESEGGTIFSNEDSAVVTVLPFYGDGDAGVSTLTIQALNATAVSASISGSFSVRDVTFEGGDVAISCPSATMEDLTVMGATFDTSNSLLLSGTHLEALSISYSSFKSAQFSLNTTDTSLTSLSIANSTIAGSTIDITDSGSLDIILAGVSFRDIQIGPALSYVGVAHVPLIDCTFANCSKAVYYATVLVDPAVGDPPVGGGLDIEGSMFSDCSFVISTQDAPFTLKNSSFTNSGPLWLYYTTNKGMALPGVISGCTFEGLTSYTAEYPAPVIVSGFFNVNVTDSVFSSNSGTKGCGLYVARASGVTVEDSLFQLNSGYAGIAFYSEIASEFYNTTFSENQGHIFMYGGDLSLTDCVLEGSSQTGVKFNAASSRCHLIVDNCKFTNNTGLNGAAISATCFADTGSGDATVTDSLFLMNTATVSGGAIYTEYIDFDISDSAFLLNSAMGTAGAIGCEWASLHLSGDLVAGNTASKCPFASSDHCRNTVTDITCGPEQEGCSECDV